MTITVKILNKSDYNLPTQQTKGSSGLDLHANIKKPCLLEPNKVNIIPTGIYLEIPEGYEGQVRARSGLSSKYGIILVNGIGTIDSDYRGEIKVILMNVSKDNYTINPGDRIAQLVFLPIVIPNLVVVNNFNELNKTDREKEGFGHTGISTTHHLKGSEFAATRSCKRLTEE